MFDFKKHLDHYKNTMKDTWLTPRGIMFSEGFCLSVVIKEIEANLVLESGTAFGGSCEMMALLNPETKIITTDIHSLYDSKEFSYKRLEKFENVICKNENSFSLFPSVLSRNINKVFIFIDGPKGNLSIDFVEALIDNFGDKIIAFGIHDVKYNSSVAKRIKNTFKNFLFTDDPGGVFNEYREIIDNYMLTKNKELTSISKSSLDKEKGMGYLQSVLKECPRGFGLAIIKGPFK
tara:strand:- start:653 stop:1354 length:702 start_codon:yes stop_codon:yes gene_type:complete